MRAIVCQSESERAATLAGELATHAAEMLGSEASRAALLLLGTECDHQRVLDELHHHWPELVSASNADPMATTAMATVSHELRTPLNGMVGSAELLLSTPLRDDQRELVELLQRSSTALLTIVNDVLDYSRLAADRMPLECIPFRIEQCIHDVVGLQRQVAKDKGIELVTTVDPAVPPVILGDPGRLRQVLLNLLTNALKFTLYGRVEILVTPGMAQDEIVFEVADTGIGIHTEAQNQLFEAFAQADASTARQFGGSGLGLAVCKRLVGLMGGSIRVESVRGEGSTFVFSCRLPAGEVSDFAATAEIGEVAVAEKPGRGRVLVVDDDPTNRLVVSRMLARLGFESDEAVDGVDGAARAAGQDYRLILMDCSMPVMDGYDATRVIRSLPGERRCVPIIALTAFSMPEDEQRCADAGMDHFLSKPVRLADLRSIIERVVPLAGVTRQSLARR